MVRARRYCFVVSVFAVAVDALRGSGVSYENAQSCHYGVRVGRHGVLM